MGAWGVEDRVIKDSRITESSGLAASLLHPGVVWTHNDSGHPPRIFAIAKDGSTAATLTVAGESNRDWEAITSLRNPARNGKPFIAIGDIGDNNSVHASSRIIILPEPRRLVTRTVRPQRVIRFGYPGGPRNAETLLADPRDGTLYVVTKDLFSSQIFAVRDSVWPQQTTGTSGLVTLEPVASSSASFITDGTFLPDGRILLRGYDRLFLLDPPEKAQNGRLKVLDSVSLPGQDQGESLTIEDGGRTALIGSEGVREPVLRVDLVALGLVRNASSGSGPSAAAETESSGNGVGAAAQPQRSRSAPTSGISASSWLVFGTAGVAVALLAYGTVTLLTRRR